MIMYTNDLSAGPLCNDWFCSTLISTAIVGANDSMADYSELHLRSSSESGHQTQQLLNLGLNASYDTRDKKCKTKSQKEVESYQQKMEFQATTQNIAFTQDIASKEGLKASHNGLSSIIEPP